MTSRDLSIYRTQESARICLREGGGGKRNPCNISGTALP